MPCNPSRALGLFGVWTCLPLLVRCHRVSWDCLSHDKHAASFDGNFRLHPDAIRRPDSLPCSAPLHPHAPHRCHGCAVGRMLCVCACVCVYVCVCVCVCVALSSGWSPSDYHPWSILVVSNGSRCDCDLLLCVRVPCVMAVQQTTTWAQKLSRRLSMHSLTPACAI